MVRRGRFGRQPRVAPSLTNTLISIAREMVAKRDQTIMDAWRNGGTFDGKPVTDGAVLKYWADREKDLSKDDPNYEAIKDNILQLNYGIAQSKQDLLHAQGKINDTQYAQFFLKWAGKVPKGSEFWRTLQKDAAGLIESAKAKGRAAADKAKAESFNAFVKGTTERDIAVGNALTDAAQKMASESGLDIEGDGDQVLSLLTKDISSNPDKYRVLLDSIHKVIPGWDGQVTNGFFAKSIAQADHGYSIIATRANHDGYATAYASAAKSQSDMASWGSDLKVWPVAQSYNSAYNSFSAVWDNPNSSQSDKMTAAAAFAARVNGYATDKGLDPATRAMLTADATRVLGGEAGDTPSFGAAMLGHKGIDAATQQRASYYAETDLMMKSNPGVYVYASTDKNGVFDPTGSGPLGIVPAAAVGPGAQMVAIPQLGGQAVMAMVAPHAVFVRDPNDPSASPKQVGYSVSYQTGGKTTTLYSYQDGTGNNLWTASSPWADDAQAAVDSKGDTYLTLPAPRPLDRAAALDAKYGTHFVDRLKADPNSPITDSLKRYGVTGTDARGKPINGVVGETKIEFKDGLFTASNVTNTFDAAGNNTATATVPLDLGAGFASFDPTSAVSGSRKSQGAMPGVTFQSPLAASMTVANTGMSADQVGHLAADPLFQQQFLQQTMASLGTQNIADPRIADAWSTLTQKPSEKPAEFYGDPSSIAAQSRADLSYPGKPDQKNPAYAGNLTLNFGGSSELKLPGLPSYFGQGSADLSALGGLAKAGSNFLAPILGIQTPGTGPAKPTGSPASTAGQNVITPTTPIAMPPAPTGVVTPAGILPSTSSPSSPYSGSGGHTQKPL